MSIEDEIVDRVKRGMLYPLMPSTPGDAAIRAMLIAEKLWAFLHKPTTDPSHEKRIGELRADLEVFVTSEIIVPKYLFLLSPASDGVWEIRSVREQPSLRVAGIFAAQDIYIAVDVALREELNGWNSTEWRQFKRNAKAVWRQLFASFDPLITSNVNDVVSGAVGDKFFR
jgi:hypothetical protein